VRPRVEPVAEPRDDRRHAETLPLSRVNPNPLQRWLEKLGTTYRVGLPLRLVSLVRVDG
jgi:hypothetical protein